MMASKSNQSDIIAGPTRISGHKDKTVVVDGREVNLSDIIIGMVDPKAKTFADLFGGTNIVAARALRAGMGVTTNDWRRQSWYCARAMLENREVEPNDADTERLVSGELVPGPVTRLYGEPLGRENAMEFDRIIRNARDLLAEGREELAVAAFYAITHVILEALSDYHLHLSADKKTFLGNEHLAKAPLVDAWRRWLTCEYPRYLYGPDYPVVKCHARDAVELVGEISAGCMYIDTLYPGGGYDHLLDFRMLEDLCDIFEGVDEGRIGKSRPLPKHRFGSRQAYMGSMTHLLMRTASCPQLIISINTSCDVRPEELALMCRAVGRTCDIHRHAVPLPVNATKLHHNPNHECLLDCRKDAGLVAEVARIRAELARMAQGIDLAGDSLDRKKYFAGMNKNVLDRKGIKMVGTDEDHI